MILFFLTHCQITETSNGVKILKRVLNPNIFGRALANTLSSVYRDSKVLLTPYRMYNDNVLTDFTNGSFMNYVRQFQNTLQTDFTNFCDTLCQTFTTRYPYTLLQIQDRIFSRDNIHFNAADRNTYYNNIYDNWIDRLIALITNNNQNVDIIRQTKTDIELIVMNTLNRYNHNNYQYIADGTGFFTYKYLKYQNNPSLYGSCITFTLIEQYVLHRLYIEPSRIKLIIQCSKCAQSDGLHATHTYTHQSVYNTLIKYKKFKGITHWFTNLSDISYHKIENLQIIKERDPVTHRQLLNRQEYTRLADRVKNNKLSGPVLRNIPDYIVNPILKPQSLTNDTCDYFRLLFYPVLDSHVAYILINSNKIITSYVGTTSDLTAEFPIKIITKLGSLIYETCENKLNNFNKLNRNNPISSIKSDLESIYDVSLDNPDNTAERTEIRQNITEINNFNIDDIVQNILNPNVGSRFTFDFTQNPSIYFDRTPNEEIDDSETFLKDIMTKFVNNHFYNNDETTYNFFNVVHTTFTNGINSYCRQRGLPENSILFSFKGGNIMRLLINKELQNNFSEKQMILLLDKVKDMFKKSDSDFQIYVTNFINQRDLQGNLITQQIMDEIYDDINKLTYLLLNRIRNIILLNPESYINFMQYSDTHKESILSEILASINNSSDKRNSVTYRDVNFTELRFENLTVGDAQLDQFPYIVVDKKDMSNIFTYNNKNSRGDMLIYLHEPQPGEDPLVPGNTRVAVSQNNYIYNNIKYDDLLDKLIEKYIIYNNRANTNFYISYNNSVRMHRGLVDVHFNLLRIKINFSLTYTQLHRNGNTYTHLINIPGEYIDVSIPHYSNQDPVYVLGHMHDPKPPLGKYRLNIHNKPIFSINGYSYTYFIKDLETVLFYQNSPPWLDNKYGKRIERLLILYFVEIFKITRTTADRDLYVDLFNEIQQSINILYDEIRRTIIPVPDIRTRRQLLERQFLTFKQNLSAIFRTYNTINPDLFVVKFFKQILISETTDDGEWARISKYDGRQIPGINRGIVDYLQQFPEKDIDEYYEKVINFYKTIAESIDINITIINNLFLTNREDIDEFTKIAGGSKKLKNITKLINK